MTMDSGQRSIIFYIATAVLLILIKENGALTKPKTLRFGGLLPVGGSAGSGLAGEGLLAAAKIAISEINERSDILPEHSISIDVKNTAPSQPGPPGMTMPERLRLAATGVAELVQQGPPIPMVYGSVLTPVVESSALITNSFNIIQVASVANSPTLMNRKQFPYFVSTMQSPANLNMLVMSFLKMHGWTRVGILTENVRPLPDILKALLMMANKMGVEVVASEIVESKDSPRNALEEFQREDVKVIIAHVQHLMHLKVFCEAYKMKMYPPDYVWINNNLLWDDLSVHHKTQTEQGKDFGNCTYSQLKTAAEGQFGTTVYEPIRQNDSTPTIGGKTAMEIWNIMGAELGKANISLNQLGKWALSGYDAIWCMALAINNSLPSDGTVTIDDFSYMNKTVSDLIMGGFKHVTFRGAGGDFKFDAKLSRSLLLTLDQISDGESSIIGLYDMSKPPPQSFRYLTNMSTIWQAYKGKIPKDRSAYKTLRLGVLLPLRQRAGQAVLAAAQVAVSHINNQTDILKGYKLDLVPKDTSVTVSENRESKEVQVAVTKISEFLNNDKRVLMIYGGLKSSVTAATASISSAWNVVQVSPTATDPSLSDKRMYRYFLRTSLGGESLNKLVMKLLAKYEWKRVAIVSENISPYSLMANNLHRILRNNSVEVVTSALLESNADPDEEIKALKKLNVRVIIGQYFHAMHMKVLCAAFKNNMTSPNYVWIANDMLWDDISVHYNKMAVNGPPVTCSLDEMKAAVEGQFGTRAYQPRNDDTKVIFGGSTVSDVWKAILQQIGVSSKDGVGSYVFAAYDAIWSMALALDNSIPGISPKKLEDFTYRDPSVSDVFVREFEKLTFEGASGRVQFTSSGDRIGEVSLSQVKDGLSTEIGIFNVRDNGLTFTSDENKIWSAYGMRQPKDRYDSVPTPRLIPNSLFIIYVVLAAVGILMCLIFCLTTFAVKTNSLVAKNWPVLTQLIALGCLTLNVAVIIFGLDEVTVDMRLLTVLCQAGTWLLLIGITLAYVSLITKIFGIFNYYTALRKGKKPMAELTLVFIVVFCVVLDLVILIPWQIIDPLKVIPRPLYQEVDSRNQVILMHAVNECTSYNLTYWRTACLVYKGCVLLTGAIFTWPALVASYRRGSSATDSNYLGICVFVVVLLSVVGLPLVYTITNNPAAQYGVAGGFILACSLLISSLLLVSRFLLVRRSENFPSRILAPFDSWLESMTTNDNSSNQQEMKNGVNNTNVENNQI